MSGRVAGKRQCCHVVSIWKTWSAGTLPGIVPSTDARSDLRAPVCVCLGVRMGDTGIRRYGAQNSVHQPGGSQGFERAQVYSKAALCTHPLPACGVGEVKKGQGISGVQGGEPGYE